MSLLVETYKKSTKLFLHPGKVSLDERPPGASSPEATRWVVEPRPASGSITFSAAQNGCGTSMFPAAAWTTIFGSESISMNLNYELQGK